MTWQESLGATLEFARLCQSVGVPFYVVGSFASSIHGIPRATQDVDVVAAIRAEQVHALCQAFAANWYVAEEAVAEAVRTESSFNFIHLATMTKLDVFLLGSKPQAGLELLRSQRIALDDSGIGLDVASAEDTVVHKLRWYRLGNEISAQQWKDVLGILRVQQGRLDGQYLQETAEIHGVADLLTRVLAQV